MLSFNLAIWFLSYKNRWTRWSLRMFMPQKNNRWKQEWVYTPAFHFKSTWILWMSKYWLNRAKRNCVRKHLVAAVRTQKNSDFLKNYETYISFIVLTKHAVVSLEEITYDSYFKKLGKLLSAPFPWESVGFFETRNIWEIG